MVSNPVVVLRWLLGSTSLSVKLIVFCFVTALLSQAMGGCVTPSDSGSLEGGIIPHVYNAEVYNVKVEALEPAQCGRCHKEIYDLTRSEGGKHRIDCKKCHVQFHTYRPGRTDYEKILPKCETCHGERHGTDLAQCLGCHREPHAPRNIPAQRVSEQGCPTCHPKADQEIKRYKTQHSELYCHTCHHTRHRNVPECIECHEPHTEGMSHAECLSCHPPHKVLEVVYPADTPKETCAICHRNSYEILKRTNTRHSALLCAKCHPRHRLSTRCGKCHADAHSAAMSQKFRVCAECHGSAHSTLLMH